MLLDICGLNVEYGVGTGTVRAVTGVDLRLRRGEVLGLAGESGSGKSTLAFALTRLLRPPGVITGGEIRYFPRSGPAVDVLAMSDQELRNFRWAELAIVFQSAMNALNPVLSLRAQILDVLAAHRPQMGRQERIARMRELLRLVGISPDRAAAFPHELSGGMRQRAVIAIALALEPEIIVMDEPTTALDVVMQRQILTEIMGLQDLLEFSVIFITHDLSLLIELADSIAVMYGGRIVEFASPDELYREPRHPYSEGLLSSFPLLEGPRRLLTGIEGSPPDLRRLPSGCAFHPRCRLASEECSLAVPALLPSPVPGDRHEHLTACLLYESATPPHSIRRLALETEAPQPLGVSERDSGLTPILEAQDLIKQFPVHRGFRRKATGQRRVVQAVGGVSFALYPGEITALVGESGSGKSTIARLLAQLHRPSGGHISLHGQQVRQHRGRHYRDYVRQVQIVLQDPFSSLNPTRTIGYHLRRPLRIHRVARTRHDVAAGIEALLSEVQLVPGSRFASKYPHELSGGQRQRVAVARALAARPAVILADEPVSMLDVSTRLGLLNLLRRLTVERGLALLYITHDIASARYFANTTLVMYAGQLIEGGPAEQVAQSPAHPYTQLLKASSPDPGRPRGGRETPSGDPPSLIDPPAGCRFHPRCPYVMDICKDKTPPRFDLPGGQWAACWLHDVSVQRGVKSDSAGLAGTGQPVDSPDARASEPQEKE
jgi:peptide/nickel transport system ATP-binding protein